MPEKCTFVDVEVDKSIFLPFFEVVMPVTLASCLGLTSDAPGAHDYTDYTL